jgi:hypothetical protein
MKTGGTSLLHQVLANIPAPAIWGAPSRNAGDDQGQLKHYTSVELLQGLGADDRSSIEVVMGHLPFAVVDVAGFREATIATVVREPVARTISHLSMCRRWPEHRGQPIEQVYEDEFLRTRMLVNHQTKMLGMTEVQATTPPPRPLGPPHPGVVDALLAEGYFDTARYVLEDLDTPVVWPVAVDRSTLDRARRNLERVHVLGLHAEYDAFLDRLGRHMGWTVDPGIWVNRGMPMEISPSLRRRVEDDNALDLELYEHARNLVRA